MRAVIVDDEKNAADFVSELCRNYFPEIEIAGFAHSGTSAVELIQREKPTLVFLDVEMPSGNGFYALEKCAGMSLKVIFITAYNHYALQAIKFSAVDYLLKPIDIKEFKQAVNKAISSETTNDLLQQQYKVLLQNLEVPVSPKLAIPVSDGYEYIEISHIIRIEAERSYCNFIMKEGRKILVSRSMGDYQELLLDRGFFRCHHSHLVNMKYVSRFSKSDGGFIELANGNQLPLSRSKRDLFLSEIKKHSLG